MRLTDVMKESRESLLNWLQRNDRNGAYTDEALLEEFGQGVTFATLDIAREQVFYTLVVNTDYAKVGEKVSFDQLVAGYVREAIDEIVVDINRKVVPKKVRSFSELHDYTDANMYGGAGLLIQIYDLRENITEVINLGQTIIDLWLRMGHVDSAHSSYGV